MLSAASREGLHLSMVQDSAQICANDLSGWQTSFSVQRGGHGPLVLVLLLVALVGER